VRNHGSLRAGLFVLVAVAAVAAAATARAAVPSACTVLTKAQPEKAFGHGKTLAVSHRTSRHYGSGATATSNCTEDVGTQLIVLSLTGEASGGFGGVKVTSQTHPSGLGAGATLTVGTAAGSGKPVDFISFHRGSVYATINANGASPTVLTGFARTVYKLIP
jgi:hypothetical protein